MSVRKTTRWLGATAILGTVGYFSFWPVPLDPVAWQAPSAPRLEGPYAANDRLAALDHLMEGAVVGPEDIAIDPLGHIYAGGADGLIVRAGAKGAAPSIFAATQGRPLGLDFDAAGNLIVADAMKGLLSVAPDGAVDVLATSESGIAFGFTNDVDIGPDGLIYFTDSSFKRGPEQYMDEVLEHRPHGRLLAYDPDTRSVRKLLGDLHFANGVAASPDGTFVLVVETTAYRVRRYWLSGPLAGRSDVFVRDLPGFPDGISAGDNGIFWLAIYEPRSQLLDAMSARPFLRRIVGRLPRIAYRLTNRRGFGFVLGFDEQGRVVHNLQDGSGGYAPVTSVEQHQGRLYLGSLAMRSVGVIGVPRRTLTQ